MVQEGAAAVAQSAAAKKKKNKNKNKKKTGGQAGAGASSSGQPQLVNTESEDRSRSSSETAPAVDLPAFAPAAVAESEPVEIRPDPVLDIAVGSLNKSDLISNLAKEVSDHVAKFGNWAEIRDAEKLYYQHLNKTKVWTFFSTNHWTNNLPIKWYLVVAQVLFWLN